MEDLKNVSVFFQLVWSHLNYGVFTIFPMMGWPKGLYGFMNYLNFSDVSKDDKMIFSKNYGSKLLWKTKKVALYSASNGKKSVKSPDELYIQ